jgi:phosphodiesterase/alkaline phosphatase D-like protein
MTKPDSAFDRELSRRKLIAAAGLGGGALLAASVLGAGPSEAAPGAGLAPAPAAMPPIAGLHLQFGTDASAEMVVSWHSLQPVRRPRVMLGRPDGTHERTVEAREVSYADGKSGQLVYAYHARLERLKADTAYMYAALHDGAPPEFGTFRTAPRGRARFTFTSFGVP